MPSTRVSAESLASAIGRKRRHASLNICSSCGRIEVMKTTLTAKLKLLTTPDQFRALRATMLAYRDGLNYVSAYPFAHRKTSRAKRLQKATYADLRTQFGLPSETGRQRPTSGGRYLQGAVDQSQEERRSSAFGLHQTPLQRAGQSAPLYLTDTPLQSGPRLLGSALGKR